MEASRNITYLRDNLDILRDHVSEDSARPWPQARTAMHTTRRY